MLASASPSAMARGSAQFFFSILFPPLRLENAGAHGAAHAIKAVSNLSALETTVCLFAVLLPADADMQATTLGNGTAACMCSSMGDAAIGGAGLQLSVADVASRLLIQD